MNGQCWIPLWACHWTFFSSGSSPFPSLQFFQTGTIMDQSFDCGMATPSLTWCPVFLLEVGSISSLSLLLGISYKVPPFEFWESLTSHVPGAFWGFSPTSWGYGVLTKRDLSWLPSKRPNKKLKESDADIFTQSMKRSCWPLWLN